MGWKGQTTIEESKARVTKFDNDRKEAGRTDGSVIPKLQDLNLGEAREFELAILHIDIDNFKGITSKMSMKGITRFLSIFLTEMTYVIKDFEGDVENYAGDRVTALFGAGQEKTKATQNCLDCGLTMLTIIQYVLNPYLKQISLPLFNCTVGMDFGETWIERVGIKGENQLTLVGQTVNLASQLQEIAKPNQILLGGNLYNALPPYRKELCSKMKSVDSWNWTQSGNAYPYYEYIGIWKEFQLVR